MSLFKNLTSQGLEETQDRLGGGGAVETDIYSGRIKVAYAGESKRGAKNVTILVALEGGREYRETVYITNAKGENFFLNKQDNSKKVPLPGFTVIDDICLCTTGAPLADQDVEEKTVKVYDFDAKAEIPKSVPVLVGLIDQPISLGIVKSIEDKSKDDGNGNYVPTGETREVNTIDKVFHTETRMTTVEARNGADEAGFWDAWLKKNKGQTRDKTSKEAAGQGGAAGAPRAANAAPQAGGNAAPAAKKSLFGNKK